MQDVGDGDLGLVVGDMGVGTVSGDVVDCPDVVGGPQVLVGRDIRRVGGQAECLDTQAMEVCPPPGCDEQPFRVNHRTRRQFGDDPAARTSH